MLMHETSIDERIIKMRKEEHAGLFTIHKWLVGWEDFQKLDEIVVLAHILRILHINNIAVSKNEVRYTFNKFWNRYYHGDKNSYLRWLYTSFGIKEGTIVKSGKARFEKLLVQKNMYLV